MIYAINYGIPALLSPFTFIFNSGQLKRMFESWYRKWNISIISLVLAFQIFIFWPNDYYLGDFPWEAMFVYTGAWTLHLGIYLGFRNNLYRWAYGAEAYPENLDREYIDYCCNPSFSGSGPSGERVLNCAVVHEKRDLQDAVCHQFCAEWGFCSWYNKYSDIQEYALGSKIQLLEGETVDYCCDDYDQEREQWICRTVPEGGDDLCYDYCVRYGLCNYFDWATTANVTYLQKDFCCKGLFDDGSEFGAEYPCTPVNDNETCQGACASDGMCTRTDLDNVDLSKDIIWNL